MILSNKHTYDCIAFSIVYFSCDSYMAIEKNVPTQSTNSMENNIYQSHDVTSSFLIWLKHWQIEKGFIGFI